ncbi:MAG: TolC family protein [Gammaproteobacteria bacterium]
MFKKKLVGVLVASTFTFASVVQSADLNSVLTQALSQDPDVLEAANVRMSRIQQIDQAKAGYKPTLDLNAGYGYEYTDSPSTRERLNPPIEKR